MCIIRAHEVQELGFHKHFDPSSISDRLNHSLKMKNSRRVTSAILSPHRQFQPDALAHPKSPKIESSTKKPFSFNNNNDDDDDGNDDKNNSFPDSPHFSDSNSSDMFECEIDIPSGIYIFISYYYYSNYFDKIKHSPIFFCFVFVDLYLC